MKFTKANFRKLTGLDHFYAGFTKSEIADLKSLAHLPCCRFTRVKSGNDSWQGVYWHSASGSYFEMIESTRPGLYQIGVAISATEIQYTDIRLLKTCYSGAKSLTSFLRKAKDGSKWFDAIYKDTKENLSISIWAMHYFFSHRERKVAKVQRPSVIERFVEMEMVVNPRFVEDLKNTCFWAPFVQKQSRNVIELEFLQKDRSPFKIKCKLDSNVKHSTFVSLKAQATPFKQELPKMKNFEAFYRGKFLILRRKK